MDITPWLVGLQQPYGGPRNREKDQRYSAAVLAGFLMIVVAILSPIVISFTRSVPTTFIDVLAGVAMLSVIANNFTQAFSSPLKMGDLFALMTTLSGITLFNIDPHCGQSSLVL